MVMVRPPGAMASRTDPGAACERRETIRHVLRAVPCVLMVLALLPVARITYRPCRRRVARPRFIGLGERETLKSAVAPGSRSALRLFAAVDAGRCGSAGPRAGAYDHRLAQTLQETFQLGRRPFLGPHPVVKSPHPIIDSADSATQLTPNVMQLVAYPADVTAQLVPDAVQLAAYSATCFYGARCRRASIQGTLGSRSACSPPGRRHRPDRGIYDRPPTRLGDARRAQAHLRAVRACYGDRQRVCPLS